MPGKAEIDAALTRAEELLALKSAVESDAQLEPLWHARANPETSETWRRPPTKGRDDN